MKAALAMIALLVLIVIAIGSFGRFFEKLGWFGLDLWRFLPGGIGGGLLVLTVIGGIVWLQGRGPRKR